MTSRFASIMKNLQTLQLHRAEFLPLANCVFSAFSILLSLGSLRHEYQFTVNFLVALFDLAVGGESKGWSDEFVYTGKSQSGTGLDNDDMQGRKAKESLSTTDLLGVNVDEVKQKLNAENKDFSDLKGG